MRFAVRSSALALLIAGGLVTGAHASVIYSNAKPTGPTILPGSYSYDFNAAATRALATVELQGYGSLDGQNFFEDDVTFRLNGTAIYKATFDLGGGGKNVVFTSPAGSSFTISDQAVDVSLPILLADGFNTLTVVYDSLPAPDHAGYQGSGDEQFGVNSVTVVSAVPLPASAPLFGAALVALGAVGYGLKRKAAAAA